MRLVNRQGTGGEYGGMTFLALRWGAVLPTSRFGAFVRWACGYTELYLSDPEELDRLSEPRVRTQSRSNGSFRPPRATPRPGKCDAPSPRSSLGGAKGA